MTDLWTASPERARMLQIPPTELIVTAERLTAAGDARAAAALYREWLDENSGEVLAYAIAFNLGALLSGLNDLAGARDAFTSAITLNPEFLPPYINLGMVLERGGQTADALGRWYEVVNRLGRVNPEAIGLKAAALKQLARVLNTSQLLGNAEAALMQSLQIQPHQRDVLQHWLSLRQRQCEWPVVAPLAGFPRSRLVSGFSPLSLAAYTDDPLLQLAVAADYVRQDIGWPPRTFADSHRRLLGRQPSERRRIGYLSSDLREHAIGHLMAELFALHDRARVNVVAYYCGHAVDDPIHRTFKETADSWADISGLSDQAAAERIVSDGIEILVDINGFTHSARTGVLAMRPAPIIVNWLGFPGTTGSPFHNYIIADDIVIPPDYEMYYSEVVKRLPCYQPNNRKRFVAPLTASRHDAGLPDDGMVFCCFNAAHKITPFTWRRWMAILRGVPNSVLWMLEGVETTNDRLREHAVAAGIAPERLVFGPKLSNPFHLARYALADLFLDTSPYGAHTTGSDALWMGVPVLTMPGRSFASRVCASLVSAAGLPDLVCRNDEEYVTRAIEFGNDRSLLAPYRARLREGRDHCVLFNTPLLVSRLEQLYCDMWNEWLEGRMPRPDLSNLDIYGEIGAELDGEDLEMAAVQDYEQRYRERLRQRDALDMIREDRRLWRGIGQ